MIVSEEALERVSKGESTFELGEEFVTRPEPVSIGVLDRRPSTFTELLRCDEVIDPESESSFTIQQGVVEVEESQHGHIPSIGDTAVGVDPGDLSHPPSNT